MQAAKSDLQRIDEIVRDASPERRAESVRKLGIPLAQGAQHFNAQHVALKV
jgi:hypothetical protein